MKLLRITLPFLAVLLCLSSKVYADDDTERWLTGTLSVKLNEKVKLQLIEQLRLKHDMGNFYTYVQYAGVGYKLNDHFDTALWYKLVSSKADQKWSETHRFDIDGTLSFNLGDFKVSDRSRFERNTNAGSWLYRNRLKVQKKIRLFNRDFTPFVSNEFFLDLEPEDGYHENRGSVGFSTKFFWDTKLSAYYMSRNKKKDGSWSNANILGTTLGLSF